MKGLWLVAVSLLASSAWAQQQPGKYYVALDVGRSRIDAGQAGILVPVEGMQHGTDIGFKGLFGIQVSRYFAVEAGYTHFGSFDARNIPYTCSTAPPCTYEISASTHGPFTNLVGLWPFAERWSASVRGGAQYAQSSLQARDPDVPGTTTDNDQSSWGFLYGVGINYQVNPRMRVRLNWEQNDQISIGLNLGGGVGVYQLGSSSLLSLGLDYRF